jgi:RNA 2',3'-cyclic 3'-phosphodiesterase
LFLAVPLSDSVRSRLEEAKAELRVAAPLATQSRLDAIHLTLHFLGQVDSSRVDHIAEGLARAIEPFASFELRVTGVGAFPSPARPRVLWAGVAGQDEGQLLRIQHATAGPLRSVGIEMEERAYKPHLTLARLRRDPRPGERASLSEWMDRWLEKDFGTFRVDAVHLMRSELSARPPRYSALKTFPLQ